MKRLLEWVESHDAESGFTETAVLVLIFLLVVGSLVIAGMRMD